MQDQGASVHPNSSRLCVRAACTAGLVRRAEIVLHVSPMVLDNKAVAERSTYQPPNGRQVAPALPSPHAASWACTTNAGREIPLGPSKMLEIIASCCRERSRPSLPTAARTGVAVPWRTRRATVSKSTAPIANWRAFNIQPHRQKHFMGSPPIRSSPRRSAISSDSTSTHPSINAMVLCVDEKSQTQALERTQPLLPVARLGFERRRRHARLHPLHGTTNLFATKTWTWPPARSGRPVQAAASSPGVSELPQAHRRQRAPRPRCPPRRRQLQHPQACQGQTLARRPATLPYPLHSHLLTPGSTRSRSGSTSSPRKPSAAAHSPRSPNSRKRSVHFTEHYNNVEASTALLVDRHRQTPSFQKIQRLCTAISGTRH